MTPENLPFDGDKRWTVVLFIASWANNKEIRRRFATASAAFSNHVNFCELDVDSVPEIARQFKINMVPMIAYFRDDELKGTIGGECQDVATEIKTLIEGDDAWARRRHTLAIVR